MKYNASEILKMAEQIERNGARFYRRAAEGFEDDTTRRMLLGLAEMEDDHERTFIAMREDLGTDELDPDGEAAAYMNMMADGQVFDLENEPADQLEGGESLEHILKFAIGLEKDSITFYEGIKRTVPESLGKGRVEDIITEELKHISLLSRELRAVKDAGKA